MARAYPAVAFTDSVRAAQQRMGSRVANEGLATSPGGDDVLSPREAAFIAQRDSFYMASVSDTGWPYVQHRGGPKGFLKLLDERTLGFADFRGNRQYVSVGNLSHDDRVALILMDYPNRQRLKLMARARIVDATDEPGLVARVEDPDYRARIERAFVFDVVAYDWNCPQHITPRYTADELGQLEPSP